MKCPSCGAEGLRYYQQELTEWTFEVDNRGIVLSELIDSAISDIEPYVKCLHCGEEYSPDELI